MKKSKKTIMRNKYTYIILIASLLLASCAPNYDPSYEDVVSSNEELQQSLAEAESKISQLEDELSSMGDTASSVEMVYGNFEGEFTATVNEVIESYVDVAGYLPVAVMPFQDGPYIIYLPTDLTDELETGMSYRFIIQSAYGGMPKEAAMAGDEESVLLYYQDVERIMVSSFREPLEEELGMAQPKIQFIADE